MHYEDQCLCLYFRTGAFQHPMGDPCSAILVLGMQLGTLSVSLAYSQWKIWLLRLLPMATETAVWAAGVSELQGTPDLIGS